MGLLGPPRTEVGASSIRDTRLTIDNVDTAETIDGQTDLIGEDGRVIVKKSDDQSARWGTAGSGFLKWTVIALVRRH